jgi:Protein of unknown function (DUF2933)
MGIEPQQGNAWYRSKSTLALLTCLAIAGFFLLAQHSAQVFGALPILVVLACPLMHLFMHRRHQSHAQRGE